MVNPIAAEIFLLIYRCLRGCKDCVTRATERRGDVFYCLKTSLQAFLFEFYSVIYSEVCVWCVLDFIALHPLGYQSLCHSCVVLVYEEPWIDRIGFKGERRMRPRSSDVQ